MSLNAEQLQAVECENHCLVVACPGSGKTKLLVSKIAHVLKSDPTAKIVAVTFTRDGANELKARVQAVCGDISAKCSITTFHALAFMHLRREKIKIRLAKEGESLDYMRRAIAQVGIQVPVEEAVRAIETCKTIPHYKPQNDPVGKLFQAYTEICQKNHVMDFFDVMLLSLRMLKEGSLPVLGATHMMVDEFQDSDEVQFQYMMEHYRAGGINITAVGDDDQTIYAFRSALGHDGMVRFERETGATRITLGTNYRCHREILVSADRLISFNRSRLEKRLFAAKGRGGAVDNLRFSNRNEEAKAVSRKIMEVSSGNPLPSPEELGIPKEKRANYEPFSVWVNPGEWAVLARNNHMLENVDAYFTSANIPFYRAGKNFWDKTPPAYMLTLLQSALTNDKAGIEHILHWAGVPNEDLDAMHEMLKDDFSMLFRHDSEDMVNLTELSETARSIVGSFLKGVRGWAKNARKNDDERVSTAIHGFGEWMRAHAKTKSDFKRIDIATEVLKDLRGPLSTRISSVQKDRKTKNVGVALYTMHGSKGLEFDNVWIIGAEETILPSTADGIVTGEVEEEERRLMYVAMTRAKNALTVSSTADNTPSRFIAEAFRT